MKTLIQTSLIVLLSIGLGLETHVDGSEIYERYEVFITSKTTESALRKTKNEPLKNVKVFKGEHTSDHFEQELYTPKTPLTYLIYKRNCCFLN
jgi:hypothetical protein